MTTYVSLGSSQGKLLNSISDYTVGSLATNAGDFEVRYAATNSNGNNIRAEEVIWFLRGVIRQLEMGGTLVGASNTSDLLVGGGTLPPPAVQFSAFMSESRVGIVQSVYPEMRAGYISSGQENGSALYFDFGSVIGPAVMTGDRVRFDYQRHGRERATNVQLIPK